MSEVYIEHNIGDLQGKLAGLPANVTRKVMRDVARMAEQEAMKRYQRTTSTWSDRPRFESSTDYTSNSVTVSVGTDNDIYGFVDKGTGLWGPKRAKYEIKPKGPGYPLRFRSGYKAKTTPGVLGSGGGGPFGPTVTAWSVMHPGIKTRGFTAMIFKQVSEIIQRRTMDRLHKAIRGYLPIRVGRTWRSK